MENRTPCRKTDRALGWGSVGHVLQAATVRLGEPDVTRLIVILITIRLIMTARHGISAPAVWPFRPKQGVPFAYSKGFHKLSFLGNMNEEILNEYQQIHCSAEHRHPAPGQRRCAGDRAMPRTWDDASARQAMFLYRREGMRRFTSGGRSTVAWMHL